MYDFIREQMNHLNDLLPDFKTVDLGFWDEQGEYKEDIQRIDMTKI